MAMSLLPQLQALTSAAMPAPQDNLVLTIAMSELLPPAPSNREDAGQDNRGLAWLVEGYLIVRAQVSWSAFNGPEASVQVSKELRRILLTGNIQI